MQYNTTKCIDENQDNKTLKDMTEKWETTPMERKEDR
ncbi:replication protein Rep [Staphylococcus aureus]|nr:replication protein Rep [Staphylococcus aureus]